MENADLLSRRIKLRHLALAVAVHKHGSIRQAAEQINITQPAATRALKELEHYLGVPLFDRSRTGVTPTVYGDRFVERARRILRDVEASTAEIRDLKEGLAGQIHVGVGPSGATTFFPEAAKRLWEESPSVQICAVQAPNAQLIPALLAGELDVVLSRLVDASSQPGLSQEVLYQDPIAIVCAPGHPLLSRRSLELCDLLDQDWILPYRELEFRSDLSDAFRIAGLDPPTPKFESTSTIVMRSFVRRTQMIAGMPMIAARHEREMGSLEILPLAIRSKVTPVGLTTCTDTMLTPATLSFLDHLRDVAAAYRSADTNMAAIAATTR